MRSINMCQDVDDGLQWDTKNNLFYLAGKLPAYIPFYNSKSGNRSGEIGNCKRKYLLMYSN